MLLTTAEHSAIATAVEAAILNEGDGQAVIDAIVQAIDAADITEATLVAAIRTDLERAGGLMDVIDGKVDAIQTSLGSSGVKFNVIN